MFGYLDMLGNYKERKVANYEKDGLIIDTCLVTDSDKPYETGIIHPNYNGGDWIIVELYNTKKEARVGHNRWVKKMTAKKLPTKLKDVSTSETAKLCDTFDDDSWREYKKEEETNENN